MLWFNISFFIKYMKRVKDKFKENKINVQEDRAH